MWDTGAALARSRRAALAKRQPVAGDPAPGGRTPRLERAPYAPDGADEAPQVDPAVAAELRVLVALYEAGRRELP